MSYFGSKFWLARHKDEPLRLEVTRVKESEFWLARHRDGATPARSYEHPKSAFWLARHRDEPLLLENKTARARAQIQISGIDFWVVAAY